MSINYEVDQSLQSSTAKIGRYVNLLKRLNLIDLEPSGKKIKSMIGGKIMDKLKRQLGLYLYGYSVVQEGGADFKTAISTLTDVSRFLQDFNNIANGILELMGKKDKEIRRLQEEIKKCHQDVDKHKQREHVEAERINKLEAEKSQTELKRKHEEALRRQMLEESKKNEEETKRRTEERKKQLQESKAKGEADRKRQEELKRKHDEERKRQQHIDEERRKKAEALNKQHEEVLEKLRIDEEKKREREVKRIEAIRNKIITEHTKILERKPLPSSTSSGYKGYERDYKNVEGHFTNVLRSLDKVKHKITENPHITQEELQPFIKEYDHNRRNYLTAYNTYMVGTRFNLGNREYGIYV
jgi:hypothetical protein